MATRPCLLLDILFTGTYVDREGILRWKKNDRAVSPTFVESRGLVAPNTQLQQYLSENSQ